jgi:hypothetical protein
MILHLLQTHHREPEDAFTACHSPLQDPSETNKRESDILLMAQV